jgi:signal transduction histidine kinase
MGSAAARGNGHGLIGMRERVGLYGGRLSAGATPDGFAVRAWFPLDGEGGRP